MISYIKRILRLSMPKPTTMIIHDREEQGAWTVAALAKEGEIDSTLTTLVKETQRVKQYGFTPSEYERARINVLKQYESAYNERNNQKNERLCS